MKKSVGSLSLLGPVRIGVCADPWDDGALRVAAVHLATELGLPFSEGLVKQGYEIMLVAVPGRLELRVIAGEETLQGGLPVWVDLERIDAESGAGRDLGQPLAKAVGLRAKKGGPVTVIDATAGWGKDMWLLASLGCDVLAVERSAVVAMLLRDACSRVGIRRSKVLERIRLVTADSRHLLAQIVQLRHAEQQRRGWVDTADALPEPARGFLRPDVVYLDPMFTGAESRKTVKKKSMRVLRQLVGADDDVVELFESAMRVADKRVVVKRPARGGVDLGLKPVATHRGRGFCFDVYSVVAWQRGGSGSHKGSDGPVLHERPSE